MDQTNQIRRLSIWIFILPLIVLNLCLFISINYQLFENTIFTVSQTGRTEFTLPYIDGAVSISRTARTYPAYLIFKPGMIITAIFLVKYWTKNNKLFQAFNNENKKNYLFLIFGVTSAIFLIIHSIFLGVHFEYDLYKLFRRFVILGFIIFEIIAQILLVKTLYKMKDRISEIINKRILSLKIALVSVLTIVALASLPFLVSSGHTHFKHALEWDFFIGVISFYLLTFFL